MEQILEKRGENNNTVVRNAIMYIPIDLLKQRISETNIPLVIVAAEELLGEVSGNGPMPMEQGIKSRNINVQSVDTGSGRKKNYGKRILEAAQDYTLQGNSLRWIGKKLNLSGSGFLNKLRQISEDLQDLNIFEIFKPRLSPFVHLDVTISGGFPYYISRDPISNVIPGLLLTTKQTKEAALWIENDIIMNTNHFWKLWITDGDPDFDNALRIIVSNHRAEFKSVRTVWLGRTPKTGNMPNVIEKNTYKVTKVGSKLLVERGIDSPRVVRKVDDLRHHSTTIDTTLGLFAEDRARLVCIMSPEKYIHFKAFRDRFYKAVEDDPFIYHFIGTGHHGNPWAERVCQMIKERDKRFHNIIRNVESRASITRLQMTLYNLFWRMPSLGGKSPFGYSCDDFPSDDEVLDILANRI